MYSHWNSRLIFYCLMINKFARGIAVNMEITIMGTVGILMWAKQTGLIPSLHEELLMLANQANFRMGQDLIDRALLTVGEEKSKAIP